MSMLRQSLYPVILSLLACLAMGNAVAQDIVKNSAAPAATTAPTLATAPAVTTAPAASGSCGLLS
jgi:hypothetical protein